MIICSICGKFRFGSTAELFFSDLRTRGIELSYKVSYYLRTVSERALGKRDNKFFPIYTHSDFESMTEAQDPSVREKLQILLIYLAGLTSYPGQHVLFDSKHDYSVLGAKNPAEAEFYQPALEEQGFLRATKTLDGSRFCWLTASGWQELERIHQLGAESPFGFIAMWFDHSQDAVKLSIESAIKDSGFVPIRIDQKEHVNRIDDEMIAQIRQSKFLVADLTGQRNGVYFEAGFMLGLGRPVIWLCNESDLENVHFDARQYNTINYQSVEELKTRLQNRIEAILGRGPHKGD
jgi:nucleoside 2-deoxyribosyltransferase